eukprot:Gregarina_sp_Poly_1__920@NODE_1221_length_4734_cov_50_600814_g606_i1_p1_GENE_NODE_1221_length_4734_cov_50_600814_g606_i1NODE_1221_length_4734_cov_50_600814_g606_i1_p1_ORF_typecomplete_len473_score68_23Peptidase_M16_C/PF05193_21/1_9e09_NODE_1221_length_4734_cov_50_600814_g606_i17682186
MLKTQGPVLRHRFNGALKTLSFLIPTGHRAEIFSQRFERTHVSSTQPSPRPVELVRSKSLLGPDKVLTSHVTDKATVVSIDTHRPSSTIGVFFDFGTLNEAAHAGCGKLFEAIIVSNMKNWKHKDKVHFQLSPTVSSIYLTFRRKLIFGEFLDDFLNLMRVCTSPEFTVDKDLINAYENGRQNFSKQDPSLYFNELMLVSSLNSFGTSFIAPLTRSDKNAEIFDSLPVANPCPSTEKMQSFLSTVVRPARVAVAGCDVEHTDLVEFCRKFASIVQDQQTDSSVPAKPSLRKGISIYPHTHSVSAQAALMIDTSNLDPGVGAATPLSLLPTFFQFLLGGGDSFSSGGPGKGMFSRLHTKVLPMEGVETCQSFNFRIPGCSALGVMCDTQPHAMGPCLQLVLREIDSLGSKIPKKEVQRIKNQMRFALWAYFERAMGIVEELGRHCLQREPAEALDLNAFEQSVEAINQDAIQQ